MNGHRTTQRSADATTALRDCPRPGNDNTGSLFHPGKPTRKSFYLMRHVSSHHAWATVHEVFHGRTYYLDVYC